MLPKTTKILLFFFSLLIVFFCQTKSAAAETGESWVFQGADKYAESLDKCREGDISGECYSKFTQDNLVFGLTCSIGGYPCTNDEDLKQIFIDNSLINKTTTTMASLYEKPPADMGIWLADALTNAGIAPPAFAQGIGFSALSPILPLWKIMRNVSYALLIIVLLVIGLMVMFRTKIDPKTVISVQSALPRIVITLILITFSYPIAGFFIDLMYIILYLGISIIGPVSSLRGGDVAQIQADFAGGGGIWHLFHVIPAGLWISGGIGLAAGTFIFLPLKVASLVATAIKGVGGLGGGTAILMLLILLIFMFAIIRIFFMLLNAYINLIIAIVFAPIILLPQAIPGQNAFGNWIKNLLSNLLVFPATAILIVVANAVSSMYLKGGGNPSWTPPMLGFGGGMADALIGIGFALVIPQVVSSLKKLFGAKPIIPLGGAVGKSLGQPLGVGQQAMQTIGSFKLAFGGGRKH